MGMHRLALVLTVVATSAAAQTWNSNAGGWSTGYGTVSGSFGLVMATQNIYTSTQQNMQRLIMRQAMINKWGKAAVEKAERDAARGNAPAAAPEARPSSRSPRPPARPSSRSRARLLSNGSPEPSDEVTEALFTAMNEAIDDSPDFAKVSNKEKQQLYEMLITFTGLSLALASQAEETKDEAMAAQARELATQLLKLVLKVDAAQVRFERLMPQQ